MLYKKISKILLCVFLLGVSSIYSQSINFGSSGLVGANINNPTSLDFGPNNKLYVSQQDGIIWEYDILRDAASPGNGTYSIIGSNQISLIKNNTPNHNDDGTFNSNQTRQITGLLAAGNFTNPILYVTSSDSRIGGGGGAGNDVNLDTNSGVLSRLTWNGSSWVKVDLVRGLPRCEENHSTNGLDLFTRGGITYLLIQQGGNTNQGAPSNNFAGSTEFYLAGAMLIVNLTQLEQMETANGGPYLDPRSGNSPYIYDLPSLNDPERTDIDNTHPNFPYGPSHPLYNATIDLGDPFGGNNGLNQTFPEAGGPVQIFSPGYRNAYDVVITTDGRIFTGDNGPNGGWGGTPLIYDSNDQLKGTHASTTYNPAAGDYITNEFNIENGVTHGDALHYVGTINDPDNTYYGGHPAAIRAFPDKAGVYKYEYNGSSWVETGAYDWTALIAGVQGYFNPAFTIADFPGDPRQGEYLADASQSSKVNILDIVGSSTNGISEYTASNFNGAMQGNILTASFNGNINRYTLDTSGTALQSKNNGFLNGFGSIPLDLIALGDSSPFPGTIWVVTYGADDITVFEPGDFGDCFQPGDPEFDPSADYDGDGFTNQDELDNGTNHCSAGSSPNDYDGDLISDLNDTDDDNDGIADNQDVFAIDAQNGLATDLPIIYPFWNNDPGTGFFGLGFTGLMLDTSGSTDYLTQYDENNLSFGGAGGKATVDAVTTGDALNDTNTQQNAFQFGINVDENSNPFTIHGKVETPFNGSAPLAGQSYGIFIGTGDQDNYLKVALSDGVSESDNIYGFDVVLESAGTANVLSYDAPGLLQAGGVDLYITVDAGANTAQVFYSFNSGLDIIPLGNSQNLPTSFLSSTDNQGLAIGIIGTSGNSGSTYIATWDFFNVTEDQPSTLAPNLTAMDFGVSTINSSSVELNLEISNQGSPSNGSIDITAVSFTGPDAALFSSNSVLPLSVGPGSEKLIPVNFAPDGDAGSVSANLEIAHTGINSPLIVPLNAILEDPSLTAPLVRINAGGGSIVSASDGGPDWEPTPASGAYSGSSFSVNTGNNYSGSLQYANRDASIPSYIGQSTFNLLFAQERWDAATGEEMRFDVPLPNGSYTINIFAGNSFIGTNQEGERIFDILIEGNIVQDDLDLIAQFGHQAGGMLSFPVTLTDGVLNIEFGHVVENPLVNAIEILGEVITGNQPPVAVASATPLSGEAPLEVTFTGSASTDDAGITEYLWDFGDGNTDTTADPVHTYNTIDSYTVTLMVTDAEGLQDTEQLTIDVTPDLPPALVASPNTIDFGQATINSTSTSINLDLFNNGGTGEDISITAIQITGADAVLFSQSSTLPLVVEAQSSQIIPVNLTPDNNPGIKTANLEITHTGDNSPLLIPLNAELVDTPQNTALVRINTGGSIGVAAVDGGPDWEPTPVVGAYTSTTFTVNTGDNFASGLLYTNRDASIPAYIDQNTFNALFAEERWDEAAGEEMRFDIPLPNGSYTVNIFAGNSFIGTDQVGERVFDILIEGNVAQDDLDLVAQFGHQAGGMLSFPVTLTDGVLNIEFGHVVENPLVNAIEIIGGIINQPPVAVASATPLTGEAPLDVSFTGSGSTDDNAVTDYLWDFGDGNSSTLADPAHTYTAVGTYTVSLTVSDAENLQDTDQFTIDVTPDLPPALVASPNTIDFGQATINSTSTSINLDLFNNGGTGEDISITAIQITGTDAVLFSQSSTLPLVVEAQSSQIIPVNLTPDNNPGIKTANLEITHTGDNSPLLIPLNAELTDLPPLVLDPIADQFNQVGQSNGVVLFASGGDPNENVTYDLSGQPAGISVEPTNGQLIGIIEPSAVNGGPANDGVHIVTVTATKPGSADATLQFTWTISNVIANFWFDKNEDENYTARHECSFVQAGDKFYMFGGRENAQTLDVYDYTTNTWNSLVNSSPIEFNHFQAVEYQGLIWVIGAFKTNNFPFEQPADYIWAYNPASDEWIQGPEIPANRKRGSAGLVLHNDKFYVLAGNTIGHNGGYVNWFDEYDPATGTWTVLADAPRARDHFHAAVINGKLYAASGRLSGGDGGTFGPVIPEVDVYDFNTQNWSTLPASQNIPTPRAAAVVANFENKLIVAGGESPVSTSAFDITEIYDPASQTWTNGDPLNHPRHGTQGIVSGNGIFVAGGSPVRGGGNQTNMEYYGQDSPVGTSSLASSLSSEPTYNFTVGETQNIVLSNLGGNTGSIINSIQISGTDAEEFNIDSGNILLKLINVNDTHTLIVSHIGPSSNKSAVLTVTYNNNQSLIINLNVPGSGNQPPVAVASATPLSGDAPLDVSFTGSGSIDDNAVTAYLWDFGDGNSSTLADPTHIYSTAGTYTVTLTVSDVENLQDSDQLTIVANTPQGNQPPVAVASATPISGASPLNVTFTGSASTDDEGIISYLWDFNDGTTSTEINPSHLFTQNGNYNVTLTVSDAEGLQDQASVQISVADAPTDGVVNFTLINATTDVDLSELTDGMVIDAATLQGFGHNIRANTNPAVVGSVSLSLSGPVNNTRTESVAPYALFGDASGNYISQNLIVGDYTLAATAYSQAGLNGNIIGSTLTINFSIQNIPSGNQPPVAVASATPLSGDAPLDVSFTGSGSTDDNAVIAYLWDFGDGNSSTQADPSHTYINAGNYTVTLTVSDAENLQDSDQLTIVANTPQGNQPPVAVASATPISGASPLNVTFTGSASTDDEGIISYLWDFNDGTTSTEINPSHLFTQNGNYNVTLTVSDAEGLQDQTSIQITLADAPTDGVVSFTLINATTDLDLFELTDGMVIDAATLQGFGHNIRANTNPSVVGSVSLSLSGPVNNTRTESVAPYALFGDTNGNYSSQNLTTGSYTLAATAYSQAGSNGSIIGSTFTINFSIQNIPSGGQEPLNNTAATSSDSPTQTTANPDRLELRPNPSNIETVLEFTLTEKRLVGDIYIFSMNGRLVKKVTNAQPDLDIYRLPTYNLEEGIYILSIPISDGTYMTKKLIVKH